MLPLLRAVATLVVVLAGWWTGAVFNPLGFALTACVVVVIWAGFTS